MKILINGQEKEDIRYTEQKIGGLLNYVSKSYVPSGEIISEVKVDGQVFLFDNGDKDMGECASVEVVTSPASKVLVEGLLQAYEMLKGYKSQLTGVADRLGTREHQDALRELAVSMDVLRWFGSLIDGLKHLMGVTHNADYKGMSIEEYRSKLNDALNQLVHAMESENFVLVADILKYDFIPCIVELENILPSLIKEADKRLSALS